ncbi:hypothetical protein ES705_20969 [subsurface metagenome]
MKEKMRVAVVYLQEKPKAYGWALLSLWLLHWLYYLCWAYIRFKIILILSISEGGSSKKCLKLIR